MQKNKFYVTTPIYYVTAAPHLGSLYSTILADVAARYHLMQNKTVFFLTGTDEHGQKIAEAANKAHKKPQEFVDSFIPSYKDMWKFYNINYTKFIRTTDAEHEKAVQTWLLKLIEKGDIYKDSYTGWYCTPCETFVTEKDKTVQSNEIVCPSCARATQQMSEECYFFKLSAYADKLLAFYEQNSDFITPKERLNEIISFVKEGLKDLSISRSTISWGIPFPGDTKHVTYVWADALNNYITAIGYGDQNRQKDFNFWWPADLQILGKDIIRFHAIYWPAFLMASNLQMPKKLLVHGWIKIGEHKMSKSRGNAVDPKELATKYGVDEIRYYLTRKMAITQDSQFSIEDIEQSINSELADDLGNLLNRFSTLAEKYNYTEIKTVPTWSKESLKLQEQYQQMMTNCLDMVEQGFFYRAVNHIWEFINHTNAYFHAQEPWKQAKNNPEKFQETIANTAYSLKAIGILLWPVMPQKMEQLLASLNYAKQPSIDEISWNSPIEHIKKIETLFQKQEKLVTEQNNTPIQPTTTPTYATIEDFAKIDLRAGTILECEAVEGSDKLLKLQVDFGDLGKKQIFSGMKKYLTPSDLIGKQGIFVVNFKPRTMMGMQSEGMMLTSEGTVLTPTKQIPNGSVVR